MDNVSGIIILWVLNFAAICLYMYCMDTHLWDFFSQIVTPWYYMYICAISL